MAEFNLKSPHVSCLYYLYKKRNMCVTELADICDEDKAAISRSVDYLESAGYVFCDAASGKRYKAPLLLTEKGEAAGSRIAKKIDRVLVLAGEGLSEEERRAFYNSLAIISENLDKISSENKK